MTKRNYYRQDFKEGAVRLVTEEGYTLAKAAKHIGVDRTTLRSWVKQFGPKGSAPVLAREEGRRFF